MIRTQIYLPDEVYHTIQGVAERERVSMAQKIREFVIQGLGLTKTKPKSFLSALRDLSSKGNKNTPRDLATSHDKYLYGEK